MLDSFEETLSMIKAAHYVQLKPVWPCGNHLTALPTPPTKSSRSLCYLTLSYYMTIYTCRASMTAKTTVSLTCLSFIVFLHFTFLYFSPSCWRLTIVLDCDISFVCLRSLISIIQTCTNPPWMSPLWLIWGNQLIALSLALLLCHTSSPKPVHSLHS